MRVRLRPTVAQDLDAFSDEPLPHRIQGITAIGEDGAVLGVGGLGLRPDGTAIAFAHVTEAAKRYPAAIHRAGRAAMDLIRKSGQPLVIAEAQLGNPAAERWLLRLGFRPFRGCFIYVNRKARDVE